MKEFKLRIFDKSDNKFLSINVDNYRLIYQGDCLLLSPATERMKYWPFVNILNNDNFVIQFFTGLKDKNNRDIYDGDIVIALSSDNQYKSIVQWNKYDGRWGFVSIKCGNMRFSYNLTYGCSSWEICGNIFENPELLGENK